MEKGCNMEKITIEQYEYLLPLNEKYSKWLDDKITAMRVYKPFAQLFEEIYYHFYKRDGKWHIISEKYDESVDGVLNLVRENAVILTDSTSSDRFELSLTEVAENLTSKYQKLIFRENAVNDNWRTDVYMITEFIERSKLSEDEVLRVYMLNTEGNNPKLGDVFLVPKWEKVTRSNAYINFRRLEEELSKLCLYTPQLEFFAADIIPISDSFKIIRMYSNPDYPACDEGFSMGINNYLKSHLQVKKNSFSQVEYEQEQWEFKSRYPDGFYPYLETTFFSEYLTDLKFNNKASICQELWALERGFKPYRLEQYGINESNQKDFISDLEYEYLGHINNKYRTWFEDKITIKYILNDFNECMPAYYYLIAPKNGKNRIISMMDCPLDYNLERLASYDDVFRLVREREILALKPDEGTHGAGFFKFTYADGKYYLNGKESSEEKVITLLSDVSNQYLITEFIRQHPDIARIYSGSVNTARITVFKKDGKSAQIGNGYMRFGTSETGGVDNIGAGGLGVDLDILTGYYSNAIKRNMESCPNHPDTGVLIEGYLPNWDDVVETILKIAESMPEIEYMGFDVAFTEDGIKLPEINRFPDFPKINKLTPTTMDYLLYKLQKKKEKYGYMDGMSKKSLIELPSSLKRG